MFIGPSGRRSLSVPTSENSTKECEGTGTRATPSQTEIKTGNEGRGWI
jgi:hypothetical protein